MSRHDAVDAVVLLISSRFMLRSALSRRDGAFESRADESAALLSDWSKLKSHNGSRKFDSNRTVKNDSI